MDVVVAEDVCEPACSKPFAACVDQGGDGGKEVAPPGEVCTVMLPEAVVVEPGRVGVCEDRAVGDDLGRSDTRLGFSLRDEPTTH